MSGIMNTLARSASVITLLAFLNLIVGCTANADISFDEAEKSLGRSIPGVVLVTEIEGVTLRAGGDVEFNERRGIYDRKAGWIRGVTQVGDSVEIRLSDIDLVLLRQASIDGPQTITVKAQKLRKSRKWRNWGTLNGRSVKRGEVVRFDYGGARYDAQRRLIVGRTNKGGLVEIAIDDVLLIQERKFSTSKTIGLTAIAATAIAAMILIPQLIELHNWSNK